MTSLPIIIPHGFSPLVKEGEKVKTGQILAKRTRSSSESDSSVNEVSEVIVNLTQEFGEQSDTVRKYLKKNPGEVVRKGDIIASNNKLLRLKTDKLISTVDGIILRFERDTGNLIIRLNEPPKNTNVTAEAGEESIISPLDGTITLCNNGEIVVQGEGDAIQGVAGSFGKAQGLLRSDHFTQDKEVRSVDLGAEDIEKIVLVDTIGREALAKAGAMNVAGVIGVTVDESDLAYLRDKNIALPVIQVTEDVAKKLKKLDGHLLEVDADLKIIQILGTDT